jgi:hypothetical protein
MSRTYKLHRHKNRGCKRDEMQNKSRRTHFRMCIKNLLKSCADYEEINLPAEKSIITKKRSVGYLSPLETEESLTRKILAMKKASMNGFPVKRWCVCGCIDKMLKNGATQEELKECVHKYYVSKGGRKKV